MKSQNAIAPSSAVQPSVLESAVVLFDLDGTITDSASGIRAGFKRALAAIDQPEPDEELLDKVVGPPMIDTFRSMGIAEPDVRKAIATYIDYYDAEGWADNAVFEGIEQVLADARDSGRRLAVATSKAEPFAIRILEHFGLDGYFEFIGGASLDGRRRAKSDVIAHTLRAMGTTASQAGTPDVLMIGDREHDVRGAAHWGIPCVFVEWGYGSRPNRSRRSSRRARPTSFERCCRLLPCGAELRHRGEPVGGASQTLARVDARVPAEDMAGTRDVRAASLWVVDGGRHQPDL